MPFSFTGFSGTAVLVLVGVAILFQVGRHFFQHPTQGGHTPGTDAHQ